MELSEVVNRKPTNRQEIAAWVDVFFGFRLHDIVRCPEHNCQLDYVTGAFLEEFDSCVFMASRYGGKSYAAAAVCLLDAHFKPGIKIAVTAWKRTQADFIYTYCNDFLNQFAEVMECERREIAIVTKDHIEFRNGSKISFFSGAKSKGNVKGAHPHRLLIDEVDLFTAEEFDGLANCLDGSIAFGSRLDILSTNYTVTGAGVILQQIKKYEEYNQTKAPTLKPCRVFRICLLDIMEKCDDRYQCDSCPLFGWCKGVAKQQDGYYTIARAIAAARDSTKATFESQMLLLRPSSEHSYFPDFAIATHVLDPEVEYRDDLLTLLGFDFGGGRCPHAALLIQKEGGGKQDTGTFYVIDEFESSSTLENLVETIYAKYPKAKSADVFTDHTSEKKEHIRDAKSYQDVLRRYGMWPRTTSNLKRRPTFEIIHRLISPAIGPPRLSINKRCTKLIKQIQAAEHKCWKGQMLEEPADMKPDDLLDCLRYIVGWTAGNYRKYSGHRTIEFFKTLHSTYGY